MVDKTYNTFKGLLPLIDPRRIQEPFVLDGRNFFVDADGPVSGFSRELIINEALIDPKYIQSYRVNQNTDEFLFSSGAILFYNQTANQLLPVFTFSEPTIKRPWTHAAVGGKQYFARQGVGLVQYDNLTGIWQLLTGGSIPVGVRSVASSGGRLIALADTVVGWSTIDDGTDFVTSTITGAGLQSLSIIDSTDVCDPYSVIAYPAGYVVYTSEGILRAELVNSLIPYKFKVVSLLHQIVNAYCAISYEETRHLLLTERGFFTYDGKNFEIWQPLMSEYFHDQILPNLDLAQDAIVRLTQLFDRNWIAVSISQGDQTGVYSQAYVHYAPSNEWGSFNRSHTGFVEMRLVNGPVVGFDEGYVDSDGSIFRFSKTNRDVIFPDVSQNIFLYDYHKNQEYPVRRESGINKMATRIKLTCQNETIFNDSGIYDIRYVVQESISPDSMTATEQASVVGAPYRMITTCQMSAGILYQIPSVAPPTIASLDSWIEIGPFRVTEGRAPNELTRITDLIVGMLGTAAGDVFDDWLLDYDSDIIDDWAAAPEQIDDWGFSSAGTTEYDLNLIGTLDGVTQWETMNEVPSLLLDQGKFREYSADISGLYNKLKISAELIDRNFHLKTLQLNVEPAGRLF